MWLKVALEGDFVYAPPGYAEPLTNLGNARLQAVVRQPIYAGGSLKAGVARAGAGVEAARGRYRLIEMDLELEVRSRFCDNVQTASEISIRRTGLETPDGRSSPGAGRPRAASPRTCSRPSAPALRGGHARGHRAAPRRRAPVVERADGARSDRPLELVPLPLPEGASAGRSGGVAERPDVRVAGRPPGPPRRTRLSQRPKHARAWSSLATRASGPTTRPIRAAPSSGTASGETPGTPSPSASSGTSGTPGRRAPASRRRASAFSSLAWPSRSASSCSCSGS
jgi:hypothetical protein